MEGNKIVHLVGVSWTTVALQLDRARVNQSLDDWVGGMQTTLTLGRASLGQGVNWMLLGHSDEVGPRKVGQEGRWTPARWRQLQKATYCLAPTVTTSFFSLFIKGFWFGTPQMSMIVVITSSVEIILIQDRELGSDFLARHGASLGIWLSSQLVQKVKCQVAATSRHGKAEVSFSSATVTMEPRSRSTHLIWYQVDILPSN